MVVASSLPALRVALLRALGLSVVTLGCTGRPLDDAPAGDGQTGSSGTTALATTTHPTTGAATTSAGSTGVTGTGTGGTSSGGTSTSTGGTSSGGTSTGSTSATTGPVDASTTMATTETTIAADLPCVSLPDLGQQLEPTEVNSFPGCEDYEASGCFDYLLLCLPPPQGTTCETCAPNCLSEVPPLCFWQTLDTIACGPFTGDDKDKCCHVVQYSWNCTDGRPFLVEGTARTAGLARRRDWADAPAEVVTPELVAAADAEARAELAALWTADALAEHASVASFARFALQLLAHGAPPALVAGACAAQADEVAHARVAFALASAYAGAPTGPGALALAGALAGPGDLAALVTATIHEGCVGETIAAAELDLAAQTCDDPILAATLRRLAADEQRHAALAWRTVQWALRREPGLRRTIAAAFASVAPATPPASSLPAALLRRHGRLPADARHALARECLASVIVPCARSLLTGAAEPDRLAV